MPNPVKASQKPSQDKLRKLKRTIRCLLRDSTPPVWPKMEARLIVKDSGWVWKATLRFASGGTSPDSLFQDHRARTIAETAARETKALHGTAILKLPETIDCRWTQFSGNRSFLRRHSHSLAVQ